MHEAEDYLKSIWKNYFFGKILKYLSPTKNAEILTTVCYFTNKATLSSVNSLHENCTAYYLQPKQ